MEGYYYYKFEPEHIVWCFKPVVSTPGWVYGYTIRGYDTKNGQFFENEMDADIKYWIKFEDNSLDMGK